MELDNIKLIALHIDLNLEWMLLAFEMAIELKGTPAEMMTVKLLLRCYLKVMRVILID